MRAVIKHPIVRSASLIVAVLIVAIAFVVHFGAADSNPLPARIKNQVSFKVVYPTDKAIPVEPASYAYQAKSGVLSFNTSYAGTKLAFSEQPAPASLGSGGQIYYPALGIHPYAQFKTGLGPVALTRFWQSGNLEPFGQSAVLVSQGTLLIAHSDKNLTNQQWKDLFDGLKISQ